MSYHSLLQPNFHADCSTLYFLYHNLLVMVGPYKDMVASYAAGMQTNTLSSTLPAAASGGYSVSGMILLHEY